MYYGYKTKTYFILDKKKNNLGGAFFVNYKFQNSRLTSQKKKYLINKIQPSYLSSLF